MVPDLVGKLTGLGYEVVVEPGAGEAAEFFDADYESAGARISEDAVTTAELVVSVAPLPQDRVGTLADGATTISFLPVNQSHDLVVDLRDSGVTSFAMELVPRISRAQSMDALSSQALVAGYRCAIVAAGMLRRFFPLNMTAAGTVQPAEVVVLGAGVAGLQAIATAKRLGAVVRAYDVRAAAAEEIRSMGAKAIELELATLEGTGGYAREMTEDRAARQRELLAPYIGAADALITTAAVPGREAPMLVTREMVEQMKPGSVVIDLAAESGGNVEGSSPGEVVRIGHAQVWGGANVPAQMPVPASRLYAQNIVNLVTLMTATGEGAEPGTLAPDFDDEIVTGCCVTHDGEILHKPTREAIQGPDPEPEPEPEPSQPSVETADSGAEGVRPGQFDAAAPASATAPGPVLRVINDDPETAPLEPNEAPLEYLPELEPDPEPVWAAEPPVERALAVSDEVEEVEEAAEADEVSMPPATTAVTAAVAEAETETEPEAAPEPEAESEPDSEPETEAEVSADAATSLDQSELQLDLPTDPENDKP